MNKTKNPSIPKKEYVWKVRERELRHAVGSFIPERETNQRGSLVSE
jgi:hypothetical protein